MTWRAPAALVLLVAAVAGAAGAGDDAPSESPGDADRRAIAIASEHERVAPLLEHRHTTSVAPAPARFMVDDGALVTFAFDEAQPPEAWPGPTCSVAIESPNITGVVALVDLRAEEVAALSPQWDRAISCLGP